MVHFPYTANFPDKTKYYEAFVAYDRENRARVAELEKMLKVATKLNVLPETLEGDKRWVEGDGHWPPQNDCLDAAVHNLAGMMQEQDEYPLRLHFGDCMRNGVLVWFICCEVEGHL